MEGLSKEHQTWPGPHLPRGNPAAQLTEPHSQHGNPNSLIPNMEGSAAHWGTVSPTERARLCELEVTVLPGLPHVSRGGQGGNELTSGKAMGDSPRQLTQPCQQAPRRHELDPTQAVGGGHRQGDGATESSLRAHGPTTNRHLGHLLVSSHQMGPTLGLELSDSVYTSPFLPATWHGPSYHHPRLSHTLSISLRPSCKAGVLVSAACSRGP